VKQRVVLGAIGLALGAIGWLSAAMIAHFWQDHQLVDQIRTDIVNRQLQQARPVPPPPQ
jgi:hypothetical protein